MDKTKKIIDVEPEETEEKPEEETEITEDEEELEKQIEDEEEENDEEPEDEANFAEPFRIESFWKQVQKAFDETKDVDQLFTFLRALVDNLKICDKTTCEIFSELAKLDMARTSFLEYKSVEQAEEKIKNAVILKRFKDDYMRYLLKCKRVFAIIYALKVTRDAQLSENLLRHKQFLQILDKVNENQYPMPVEIGSQVQMKLNEEIGALSLTDPLLAEKRKMFEAQMHDMRLSKKQKKEKEKESVKKEEED